jgi:hypothetical protein
MDILKPNSSMPAVHDGLHVYTGNWSVDAASRGRLVVIKTELRQVMFASFYSVAESQGGEKILNKVTHLDYQTQPDSVRTSLNFLVTVQPGQKLYYHITGSQNLKDIPNSEQFSNSAATVPIHDMNLQCLITSAGTTAVEIVNDAHTDFSYSRDATGLYVIASTDVFFTPNSIFFIQLEGTGVSLGNALYTFTGEYASSTEFHIRCYRVTDVSTAIPANSPGRIVFSIKSKPTSFQ